MTEQPTITTDPTNPDQVLLHLPEFGLLDTQAWSVDVGIPAAALPALRDAITARLAEHPQTAAEPGHRADVPHACGNCEGIDPGTCLVDPAGSGQYLRPDEMTISSLTVSEVQTVEFVAPDPTLKVIRADGTAMLTMHLVTGEVTIADDASASEAAAALWDELRSMARVQAHGPLAVSVDEQVRAGERAQRQVRRLDQISEAWLKELPDLIRMAAAVSAIQAVTRPDGRRP